MAVALKDCTCYIRGVLWILHSTTYFPEPLTGSRWVSDASVTRCIALLTGLTCFIYHFHIELIT